MAVRELQSWCFTEKAIRYFQCSTQVSAIKSKTIKNQLQQNTITRLTAVITHVLSLCQLAILQCPQRCHPGLFPLPRRKKGLALERNFWKGGFGLALGQLCSLEHCVPQTAEELEGGRCTRWSRGCSTEAGACSPLCLQSFPYPQKHERGAVTDMKPCMKHRGGAPVSYSLEINSLLTYVTFKQSKKEEERRGD